MKNSPDSAGELLGQDTSRQSLLADALGRLGRFEESAPIRRQMFERSLSVFDMQRWLDHQDATRAAILLVELGDAASAEARLVTNPACIDGRNYVDLVPLAEGFRTHGCWRGEVAIYRALLRGILDRAYARAYEHAASYWCRLREVADAGGLPGFSETVIPRGWRVAGHGAVPV